jgi:hypothetical protein
MDVRAALFLPTVVRLDPEPRFSHLQANTVASSALRRRQAGTSCKIPPMWKQGFISGVSSGVSWISNVVLVGA